MTTQVEAFYAEWEHSCCGKPFRVGDEVAWELQLMDLGKDQQATWRDHLTELDPDELPSLRRTAVEQEPVSPPKGARMYGMVRTTLHGVFCGEPEQVTARIGAMHTVALSWREDPPGSRSFLPVPGQLWLHAVDSSETRVISPGRAARRATRPRRLAHHAGERHPGPPAPAPRSTPAPVGTARLDTGPACDA